jgi:hypothetical protein
MNREELEKQLAERVIEGMDLDTLTVFAMEKLREAYRDLSDEELSADIKDYAPDLIEGEN